MLVKRWWHRLREAWRDGWSHKCYRCHQWRAAYEREINRVQHRVRRITRTFPTAEAADTWMMNNSAGSGNTVKTLAGYMATIEITYVGTVEDGGREEVKYGRVD